jgi:predicted membrane protein
MKNFGITFLLRGIISSLLLIIAGTLLILFNADVLSAQYKPIIFSWQMLIIAVGFTFLFTRISKVPSLIMMTLGAFLLLPKFNIDGLEFLKTNAMAIFFIAGGIVFLLHIVLGHRRLAKHCNAQHRRRHFHKNQDLCGIFVSNSEKEDFIDYNCVCYSGKRKVDASNFKGGEVNCVFGNFELDLSEVHLAEGKNMLEVNTVFGYIILYVPSDWNIVVRQTTSFGTFADKRPNTHNDRNAARTLIISGSTVFGSGEIRTHEAKALLQ